MIVRKDLEGNELGRYKNLAEAAAQTGVFATNIRKVINGKRDTAGSCKWEEEFEEIEEQEQEQDTEETPLSGHTFQHEYKADSVKFTGVLKDVEINSLEDLLKYTNVDLTIWEVKSWATKSWTTTMKAKTAKDTATCMPPVEGKGFQGKLYFEHEPIQVLNLGFTVNFVPRQDYKEKLLEILKSHVGAVAYKAPPKRGAGKLVAEFMITDHHLGKQGFDPATLKMNWSIEEAIQEYYNVIEFGLQQLDKDSLHEIILVAGNDGIHIDNNLGQTTSGTQVADNQFFLTLFRYNKEMLISAINRLLEFAPVRVECIPGNHDETATLTMSEVLKEAYRNNPNVQINCSPNGRAYYRFGVNFLAWHHGKGNSPQKAANMMIADRPQDFATAKYRTCHVGHTHMSKKTQVATLQSLSEDHGIVYEVCPSVTPTDFWHDQNLFIGPLRRSKIFVYDVDRGLVGEHYYNILKE